MRIMIVNRQTGKIEVDLDVNGAGNIHELILENRGTSVEVEGASYSPGFYIKTRQKNDQLLVAPGGCGEVRVFT
jgi:hypothetical protein